MTDTLVNINLPPRVWVDIYAQSLLPVGTQMIAHNVGVCDVYLRSQSLQPTDELAHIVLRRAETALNDVGDAGAWAFCYAGGAINVRLP